MGLFLAVAGAIAALPEPEVTRFEERFLRFVRTLTATICAFGASVAAWAGGGPTPEVAVAGRWLRLPVPAGYCTLDETNDVERAFSAALSVDGLNDGRRVLLVFANCSELAVFRSGGAKDFGFGSYAVPVVDGEPWVLPAGMAESSFFDVVRSRTPDTFDQGLIAALFADKVPEDVQRMHAGLFSTAPNAQYVAIFQRAEGRRRKDKPVIVTAMRATTVAAGVPVILTLARYNARDLSVYGELQRAEEEVVANVRAMNRTRP